MSVVYQQAVEEDLNIGPRGSVNVQVPGGGTQAGHQIGLSSFAEPAGGSSSTWDPGTCAHAAGVSTTVSVANAQVGDPVLATLSTLPAGCFLTAVVTSAGTVTVTLFNLSGSAVDASSGTLKVFVFRT